ncbi:MAG: hypothetical protein FWE41_08110 [Coriobacteriia bacterium]|nr:hypothetical protein [Coriobacteriia bacterium]MCL2750357.1 hypothetical protein [Coriobacteriia bacterium]
MRPMTLEGYLKRYLRYLSGSTGSRIKGLLKVMLNSEPRLAEPLLTYAYLQGQQNSLVEMVENEIPDCKKTFGPNTAEYYYKEYKQLVSSYQTKEELLVALAEGAADVPVRYLKVYESFVNTRDRYKNSRKYSELAHQRILELQKEKGISNYRIYTDLKLNPGNINSYLKHGDATKVSRDVARRIKVYLEKAEPKVA